MSFRTVDFDHLVKFNSSTSSEFIDIYEGQVNAQIIANQQEPSQRTFAPSSFRCDRRSWFRLRGVEPDKLERPDPILQFSADIGTACHRLIQSTLKNALKEDWIEVSDYLASHPIPYEYSLEPSEDSLETRVTIVSPPVRFACDGIVRRNDTYYLLEIKTAEFSTWNDLTQPKSEHIDQVKCYCSLLGLQKVLFVYQDRQYGSVKCYEVDVTEADVQYVINKMNHVMEYVEYNLAPDALPKGDAWCTPARCPYYRKCSEWGR